MEEIEARVRVRVRSKQKPMWQFSMRSGLLVGRRPVEGWNRKGESRSSSGTQRIRGRQRGRGNRGRERGASIEKASICLCEIGSLGLVGLLVAVLVVALRWWPPSPFWLCQ